MTKEELVAWVKKIHGHAKAGDLVSAYKGYLALFSHPAFPDSRPEDMRQALKLMVLAKGVPKKPTPEMVDAHRAAVGPLTELVSQFDEPGDYEMLGICHVVLGNEQGETSIFKAALKIERERNAASELCGSLMNRLSQL
jgi:hypothetical protein